MTNDVLNKEFLQMNEKKKPGNLIKNMCKE